jgi:hypothetical protein
MNRKIIFIIAMLIMPIPALLAGSLVKVYEFNNPVIERNGIYSTISFDGTQLMGEEGKATLPFYPVTLLVPPGEIATRISIQFEKPVVINGDFDLLPRQRSRPISEESEDEWLIDNKFYRTSTSYPSSYRLTVETQFKNGYGIALSVFTPVRYNPKEKEVSYFQRVIVTIYTHSDPAGEQHQMNFFPSAKLSQEVSEIIQNPEQVGQYFSGRDYRTSDYDYLIITANQYVTEFDTLARFYRPRGILTKIASKESINATMTGADLQEKIRNYIIQEYQQHGIGYVLIGGDVEVVPCRGFYCQVYSGGGYYTDYGIPADLYYSALDGNWNTNGNDKWGEPDEDDLYPEIAIGRMTFSDTAELHNMIHKTTKYQASPVTGELTRPILAGESLWANPETWGSDYLKLLIGLRTDNGYTTRGIPPSHPVDTLYDEYGYWSAAVLMNHINSGRPWLHHVGHSNYTYVMKLNNSDITNANFSQANGINHNYTIVYTHGCMCGGFDQADCIAERMVGIDNFAVAFVGNSRYGWFNEGTTDGPSQHLHREFLDAMYRDSLYCIGMAHMKSKSETAPFVEASEYEPGATRWCFYDNNVLGDPMMACWTDEPHQVTAEYPGLIPIGSESVSVHISGPGGNYHNFTCSIYRNDTLFGKAETNSSGDAIIALAGGIPRGSFSLVVSGYNILPQYFGIEACNYWLGMTTDWNSPVNWYTGQIPDNSCNVIIPAVPEGSNFPLTSSSGTRSCKSICIEPGAHFSIGKDETFSVGGD